jgi:cytochrome c553
MFAKCLETFRLMSPFLLGPVLLLFGSGPSLAAELEAQIEVCTACHGEAGRPGGPEIPVLWGQEFYYLYVQLKDYKSGLRENEIMSEMVAEFSKDEMKALAQYFADKTWPGLGFRAEAAEAAQGATAASAGQCPQCHLGSYLGNSRVPRLAGQQVDYLERTMLDFKNKIRLNSPAKGSLLAAYDDTDIRAMARYLAGM